MAREAKYYADRPAALDNTDGRIRHSISIADSIKSEIDAYVLFAPSCIGEDGAAFVSAIDQPRCSFRGATELLTNVRLVVVIGIGQ